MHHRPKVQRGLGVAVISMDSHPNIGGAASRPGLPHASTVCQKFSSPSEARTPHPKCSPGPMIMHDELFRIFRPDLENPTKADFEEASKGFTRSP